VVRQTSSASPAGFLQEIAMRSVIFATAGLAVGFVLSAAAQNTTTQNSPTQSSDCGPSAMSSKTSEGVGHGGTQAATKAVILHAEDADGNPVLMMITPAAQ
jgi:hypothetical protein